MNVEELLRAAVDDAVREVPPGFADGAMRQARRQRRTTRGAVAGGVAVFAAAAAVAAVDPVALRTDAPPASGGDDGVIELDGLVAGAPPEVPWYEGGALHFGTASTPFEFFDDEPLEGDSPVVRRVPGGYVTWDWGPTPEQPYGQATIWLVRDDGERVELASGQVLPPVVSSAGDRVAWGVRNPDWATEDAARERGLTSTVVVADIATGEVVATLDDAPSPAAMPKGFVGDGLVFEAAANTSWGAYVWDLDGEVRPIREDAAVDAVSPAGDLAVLSGDVTEVVDLASGQVLWTYTDGGRPQFSPDGRHLAVIAWPSGAEASTDTPDQLVILDALDGTELVRRDVTAPESEVRWESATSLVFGAYDGTTGAALVRCAIDGGCELATEVRSLDDDPDTYDIPFVIGQ